MYAIFLHISLSLLDFEKLKSAIEQAEEMYQELKTIPGHVSTNNIIWTPIIL